MTLSKREILEVSRRVFDIIVEFYDNEDIDMGAEECAKQVKKEISYKGLDYYEKFDLQKKIKNDSYDLRRELIKNTNNYEYENLDDFCRQVFRLANFTRKYPSVRLSRKHGEEIVPLATKRGIISSLRFYSVKRGDRDPYIAYSGKLNVLGVILFSLLLVLLTVPLSIVIIIGKENPFKLDNYFTFEIFESIYDELYERHQFTTNFYNVSALSHLGSNRTHEINKEIAQIYVKNFNHIEKELSRIGEVTDFIEERMTLNTDRD